MPGLENSPLYEQNIAPEQRERKQVEKEDKMEESAIHRLDEEYKAQGKGRDFKILDIGSKNNPS